MTVPDGIAHERPAVSLEIQPGRTYARAEQLAHRFGIGVERVRSRKEHLGATPISDAYMEARRLEPATKTRRSPRRKAEPEQQGRVHLV